MAGDGQARRREGRMSKPRRSNDGEKRRPFARIRLFATILAAALAVASTARAQSYPNRPIKLIVAVLPGGPMDVMGRLIAQHLSTTLGQVFVENRAGAGTTLGAKAVCEHPGPMVALLLGNAAISLAIGPTLFKSAGYDPRRLRAVAFRQRAYVLIVSPGLPVRTVAELVAYAKAHPGEFELGVRRRAAAHAGRVVQGAGRRRCGRSCPTKAVGGADQLLGGQFRPNRDHVGAVRPPAGQEDQRARGRHASAAAEYPDVPTMIEGGFHDFVASPGRA